MISLNTPTYLLLLLPLLGLWLYRRRWQEPTLAYPAFGQLGNNGRFPPPSPPTATTYQLASIV
ncbi:MAG: hypothetical protein R3C62_23560 [Chloroflexota bacterium]